MRAFPSSYFDFQVAESTSHLEKRIFVRKSCGVIPQMRNAWTMIDRRKAKTYAKLPIPMGHLRNLQTSVTRSRTRENRILRLDKHCVKIAPCRPWKRGSLRTSSKRSVGILKLHGGLYKGQTVANVPMPVRGWFDTVCFTIFAGKLGSIIFTL